MQRTKRSTATLGSACAIPSIVAALFMTLWQQPQIVDSNIVAVYQRFEGGSLVGIGIWLLVWSAAVWLIIRLGGRIKEDPIALSGYFLLCIGTPALFALGISTAIGAAVQKVIFVDDTTPLLPEGLSVLLSAGLLVSIGGLVLLLGSRIFRKNT